MSAVEARPIKDFCQGIYDGPHATPQESNEGPIFLGIKNITEDGRLDFSETRHVSEHEFPKWTRRVTPEQGDLVFTYEATLHRYAIIPDGFRGCLGRRVALIRPNPSLADSRFLLYYFLSHAWRRVVEGNVVSGATVDRIPLERFPTFPLALPPVSIQRDVASILSAYDDLIENNRRRMALLEESARLLYQEWFVRLRFPGYEHTRIVDGVPDGWERKTLGECVTLNYGKALKADDRIEGDYPVYGSSGIVGSHEKALVQGPSIILGRKGNVGSVYWSSKSFYPIDTVYFINAESSNLYLFYALKHMHFISTDVAVPGLNRDFAYSRPLLLPPLPLLNAFLDYVTPIQLQIDKLGELGDKLSAARDLLLPRLISGDITV
jgi:type I restriction enzyme S subunit